jgi:hypothetical protein
MIARVIGVGTSVMQTPDSVMPRAARALKLEVKAMPTVRGFRWLSLEDNRALLGAQGEARLLRSANEHVRFLADNGTLRAPLDLQFMITAEFLPQ